MFAEPAKAGHRCASAALGVRDQPAPPLGEAPSRRDGAVAPRSLSAATWAGRSSTARYSPQLRGRLLASGLDSLEDEFAAKGAGAPVVVAVTDKEPLLARVTAWIEAVGEERAVARGGLLDLRDALRDDLENPPPDPAG
jgi:hypothetical protein